MSYVRAITFRKFVYLPVTVHCVQVPTQTSTSYSFQPRLFCVYSHVTTTEVNEQVSLTSSCY